MFRIVFVLGVGYVLGAKAGRRRYEQIAGTYRAVTENPATKAVLDAGRRKLADRVSPDPALVKLTAIDAETTVLEPLEDETAERRDVYKRQPGDSICDGSPGSFLSSLAHALYPLNGLVATAASKAAGRLA